METAASRRQRENARNKRSDLAGKRHENRLGRQDVTRGSSFLKSTRSIAGGALWLSVSSGVWQGFLAIAVAWIVSGVINAVVFHGAALAAVSDRISLLVALYFVRAAFAFIADQAGFHAAARVRRRLFARLLDHIGTLGPVRLAGTPTGDLVTTLTDAVAAIEPYWRRWVPALATTATLPLAVLLVVAPLDWLSGVILVVTAPLIPIFMAFIGNNAEQANQRQWRNLTRLGGHLLDAVQGLADLKLLRASKREIDVVARMAEAYRRDTMSVLRLAFLSAVVLEFFATLSIAMVAVLIGFRLLWGEMDFRTGFFILLLAPEFYAPLRAMGAQRHARMGAIAAAERLVDTLDRPGPAAAPGLRRLAPGSAVALSFENVHVAYGDGHHALKGVNLQIARGERVALVGPSGAGKSTLFALLLGFVEASAGRVLVEGASIAELDPVAWRTLIAHVPQRPHLFAGTLEDNITMGRGAADGGLDAAIRTALTSARADDFVARLAEGRQTRLGERGQGLSGGEAQRIALARAFFRPAPLVLLDEPTAHLDPATERLVNEAIADLARGSTMIAIAHRLATVRWADRILVLDDGRIVEDGSHDDLVAVGGLYARMTKMARQAERPPAGGQGRCAA